MKIRKTTITDLPFSAGRRQMTVYRPWRIDQDNEHGIVVKDDVGNVVHAADYGGIPGERGAAFREQIVEQERANAYAMVEGVNGVRLSLLTLRGIRD